MIAEFSYAAHWRASGAQPGHHAGSLSGGGFEFAGQVPFASCPDARNLDLRASLHDPFGQWMVRRFRQRSSIPVYVVADLSASMGFRGTAAKLETLAAFAAAAAYSAYRTGDPFGFIGCDEAIRRDLCLPLRFHKGAAPELYERVRSFPAQGRSALALAEVAPHLGRQRALVFLVSDFHFPLQQADAVLASLARHDVVPVVLWDSAEYERLPSWGLLYVQDPETGARRRLCLRPALRERLRAAFARRREELVHVCTLRGREPFFVVDRFDADAMTRYFL